MAPTTAVDTAPSRPLPTPGRPRTRTGRLLGRDLPAHWPLSALVLGYPLWWVLGIASFLPILLALPLLLQLARRRDLALPRGFGWWLLFLAWVGLGGLVLWSDAPLAVPGGDATRALVWGHRAAWYVAATVWMLWLIDTPRQRLSDATVHRLVGGLLAVALAGGTLALLAPTLEFPSLLELLLPRSISSISYVNGQIHPEVADVQAILGEQTSPRPKAPFHFTNTWGSVVGLSMVFAVAALARSGGRARLAWVTLFVLAPAPVIFSLNRGLWGALVLGAVGIVVLLAARGRLRLVAGVVAALGIGTLVLAQTPLADIPGERFGAQHSNERRALLTEATVESVTRGSPLVGFGNTRDVAGNFASISGGATPDCPACAAPPLGTQGQAWLILFAQGWVGLALFGTFLLGSLWRSIRCRTMNETLCTFALVIYGMQLLVYDTLGLPMLIAFLAIALVVREQREAAGAAYRPTARQLLGRLRPAAVPGLALVLLGGAAGLGLAMAQAEPRWSATTRVLLQPLPDSFPGTASLPGPVDPDGTMTIDTEAHLLRAAADAELDTGSDALRISAPANTRVLVLTVTRPTRGAAEAAGREVLDEWLRMRRDQLDGERSSLFARFDATARDLRSADGLGPTGEALRDSTRPADRYIGAAKAAVAAGPTSPGEVITRDPAVRRSPEYFVPLASGLGVGLLAAAALSLWPRRPAPRRREVW